MPDPADRAEIGDHFDAVGRSLQRDIVAMRDSAMPTRFDEGALDRADAHFAEGFAALHQAVNGND